MTDLAASDEAAPAIYPQPLSHWYPSGEPNEPIPIYAGPALLCRGESAIAADVRVSLSWQPSPWIEWEALTHEPSTEAFEEMIVRHHAGPRQLRLRPSLQAVPAPPSVVEELELDGPGGLEEGRESRVLVAEDSAVDEVRFSVVNMP